MAKPDKSKGQRDRMRVIDDEKKRALDLSQMNLVPPSVGIFDEPTRCYRINHEWGKIVMGLVSWLATVAPWRDATEDNYIGIIEILRFMQGDNCDMPFQLRQNPTNACIVEQSTDGGETWLTAFDLSLCMSIVDGASQTSIENNFVVTNLEQFQEYVYNNYVTNYVNNVTDLVPELGYGNADDQFRDAALCYALRALVDAVCEGALKYLEEYVDTANEYLDALALTVAIVAIVGIAATGVGLAALATGAALWGAGIGIGDKLGGLLINKWQDATADVFEDMQAREDVVCCLFETLKGANFNQDTFLSAFGTNCGLTGNALEIFESVALFAQEDATYASMVEKMRIGLNSAKLGLLPNCPCESGYSMLEYDFTLSDQFWSTLNASTYAPGQYWQGLQVPKNPPPVFETRQDLHIRKIYSGAKIKVVGLGVMMNSVHDCDGHAFGLQVWNDGVAVGNFGVLPAPSGTPTQWTGGISSAPQGIVGDEIRLVLVNAQCNATPAAAQAIKIRVWLDTDSEVRGRPEIAAPIGVGANGTTSLDWWQ